LVQPREENDWTTLTEEHLLLRRCAYWLSLKGREQTANREKIRVSIPRTNLFSVESLQNLMLRVRTGDDLI